MVRRRMMFTKISPPVAPLYPSYKGTINLWQVSGSITDNVIDATAAQGNRNMYFSDTKCEGNTTNMTTTWFHWNAGDTVEIIVKDITFTGSSTASNYINLSFYNTSKSIINSTYTRLGGSGYTFGAGSGTIPDTRVTFTATSANIGSIRVYFQYGVHMNFKLQVKVNGVLYAI